jgi:hypothetical protein
LPLKKVKSDLRRIIQNLINFTVLFGSSSFLPQEPYSVPSETFKPCNEEKER